MVGDKTSVSIDVYFYLSDKPVLNREIRLVVGVISKNIFFLPLTNGMTSRLFGIFFIPKAVSFAKHLRRLSSPLNHTPRNQNIRD